MKLAASRPARARRRLLDRAGGRSRSRRRLRLAAPAVVALRGDPALPGDPGDGPRHARLALRLPPGSRAVRHAAAHAAGGRGLQPGDADGRARRRGREGVAAARSPAARRERAVGHHRQDDDHAGPGRVSAAGDRAGLARVRALAAAARHAVAARARGAGAGGVHRGADAGRGGVDRGAARADGRAPGGRRPHGGSRGSHPAHVLSPHAAPADALDRVPPGRPGCWARSSPTSSCNSSACRCRC